MGNSIGVIVSGASAIGRQGSENHVRIAIRAEAARQMLRKRWLRNQDAVGMAIFVGSLLGMVAITSLYLTHINGWMGAVAACLGVAYCQAALHELEHDLIHNLYFASKKSTQNFMFALIWVAKLHVNPWWRREIHLQHHIHSGQEQDVEERLLGLGHPFGIKRVVSVLYPFSSTLYFDAVKKSNPDFDPHRAVVASLPAIVVFNAILVAFVASHVGSSAGISALSFLAASGVQSALNAAMVLWVAPSMVRFTALTFVATYCHYWGDIPRKSVSFENQVLDHWVLKPLNLLCFNFGGTHIIHHFVPGQPFYLRAMVAKRSHEAFREAGIRFNDLGALFRNNHWEREEPSTRKRSSA
jgi:fatty acid desaturase